MPFPGSIVWQVDMPGWVSLQPIRQGNDLIVRVGKELRAVDLLTGRERWKAVVDPDGGWGSFLKVSGELVLTDRQPDPKHLTQVIGVRHGEVVLRADVRCRVAGESAAVVADDLLVMVGNDPSTGDVLVSVDLAGGQTTADVSLPSGADSLSVVGERLVVLNRVGSPGLRALRRDGTAPQPIEQRHAHDLRLSGGRLLATLGNEKGETRHVQARDLSTFAELWTLPANGPACGLDGDAAVYTDGDNGQWTLVLLDAATGKVRWKSAPRVGELPGSIQFAGDYVLVTVSLGMTAYRRSDGQLVGQLDMGRTAQFHDGRIYVGGFRALMCCEAH